MGVGSYLSRFFERQLPAHFLRIELLVALAGGALPALLFLANAYTPGAFRFLLYALVLLVGMLVGLEIPLVMRILKRNVALKDLVSQVLTFDYLGALAVSLAFPLVLVPHLGLIRTGLLFGLMNASVALWALWLFRHELRRFGAHAVACGVTLARAGGRLCGGRPDHHADRRQVLRRPHRLHRRLALPAHRGDERPGRRPRRASPVSQRQPAVRRARRIPLPRGAGAPGDGRLHLGGWRAEKGGGAGRRRRHGGARDPQVPRRAERHPGRAGPGHDHAVHAEPHAGPAQRPCAVRRRRSRSSTPTPSSGSKTRATVST